jgi:hypothetical protein
MPIAALAETGTRGLLGAVIGGKGERSEVPLARKLVPLLREGMLLLAGRACDAADLLKEVSATGAHFLVRGSAARKPAVDEVLPGRDWAGHDLADMLGIKPRNMLTQLAEWTRWGFLIKTGKGRYALSEPVSGLVTSLASP